MVTHQNCMQCKLCGCDVQLTVHTEGWKAVSPTDALICAGLAAVQIGVVILIICCQ